MVRLTSIQQTLSLRGTTHEIVIMRSLQFMGKVYNPGEQGHIIIQISHNDISRTQRPIWRMIVCRLPRTTWRG